MCRLIEGQMPDYVSLIPNEFVAMIEISARDLLAAVRKAAVLTTRDNAVVSLQFGGGALSIRVSSQDVGSGVVPVALATASGEDLEVNFTVQFLSDGLRALGDASIRLGLQKGKGAAVMHAARSFRYAFMPVKFKGAGEEE
jgi:DNA polymerase-3 subunit beta